jgi:hypothetical protein
MNTNPAGRRRSLAAPAPGAFFLVTKLLLTPTLTFRHKMVRLSLPAKGIPDEYNILPRETFNSSLLTGVY